MNKTFRVEIKPRLPLVPDVSGQAILSEIKDFGITSIKKVDVVKVYKVGGIENEKQGKQLKGELFLEPFWQKEADGNFSRSDNQKILEISLKPGVTNTEIDSIISAAKDLGFLPTWAQSDRKVILWGKPNKGELNLIVDKILINKTIEKIVNGKKDAPAKFSPKPKVAKIKLRKLPGAEMLRLSKERLLYLSLEEMKTIQSYFAKKGRDPTDCELETIAQTWSEHCFHKTFKSPVKIDNVLKLSFIERIKAVTRKINHRDCLVTFSDNAGIVSFDEHFAFCAKCETHNSPSALEPYGGAMTGSGGVFRDIAGAGLGAKNIAGSDIFCFGNPEMRLEDVPAGCLHPRRIMQKCVEGVRDYGNKVGVPTVNGSLTFDESFRAKPVVLVGAFGLMPKKFIFKKKLNPGDLIVSIGGKTGRDGIHGATFSSSTMTKETEYKASSAVQIGNPIEEKKMFDALNEARDSGIIKYISDCGGGGYSSAIAEMGKDIGVKINLNLVPLKYAGLAPWEIWLSESQERMVIAISPKNRGKLARVCRRFSTSYTVLGKFTGNKKLQLSYGKKPVADLSMDFLFNGLPKKILEGEHIRKFKIQNSPASPGTGRAKFKISKIKNYASVLKKILSNLNVASKEEIVRRYDHEVQGRLALKPFLGVNFDGPQDGAIVAPLFGSKRGLAFGHGLAVPIAKIDPYWGAALAVDEALRNVVALGADPARIFLLDNFIFPYPEKDVLGDLDMAVSGMCAAAQNYGTPFISGKDSLSGTYKNDGRTIRVPPTIIITSVGVVPDIRKTVTSDFKSAGNYIYILGETQAALGGSVFAKETNMEDAEIPKLDFKKALFLYKKLNSAILGGLISSCHDISEGGLAVSLCEMCFGASLGAAINLDAQELLFAESGGRFVVEVEKSKSKKFEKLMEGSSPIYLGKVTGDKLLRVSYKGKFIISEDIMQLKKIWQSPFRKYF